MALFPPGGCTQLRAALPFNRYSKASVPHGAGRIPYISWLSCQWVGGEKNQKKIKSLDESKCKIYG